jgi:hypothetical protein
MEANIHVHNLFLLSTFRDLTAYREAVIGAMTGIRVIDEIYLQWAATPNDAEAHTTAALAEADRVFLIVAQWYGATSETNPLSITEKLYREAVELGIPVTAFFIDDTLPWPPAHIQFDALDQLRAFKSTVRENSKVHMIQTPEQCAELALAALHEQSQDASAIPPSIGHPPPCPIAPRELTTTPDALVSLGLSVEGIPFWLYINRLDKMQKQLSLINNAMSDVNNPALQALAADLKIGISHYTHQDATIEQIHEVALPDGTTRQMFVSRATLADLFPTVLTSLIPPVDGDEMMFRGGTDEPQGYGYRYQTQPLIEPRKAPQSTGGINRFLGVDLASGALYSMGKVDDSWTAWRTFHPERLIPAIQTATLVQRGKIVDLDQILKDAFDEMKENSFGLTLTPSVDSFDIVIPRSSVVDVVRQTTEAVAALHEAGQIHGDIKPGNVLLTQAGILPIDGFDITGGELAPGWTPAWGAPEQALRIPVTPSADVFALARMLAAALKVSLVGELRLVRIHNEANPFVIYVDPVPHLGTLETVFEEASAFTPWAALIQSGLKYDPAARPSAASFAAEIATLLREHPPKGTVNLSLRGNPIVGKLADGSLGIVRVLEDKLPNAKRTVLKYHTHLLPDV